MKTLVTAYYCSKILCRIQRTKIALTKGSTQQLQKVTYPSEDCTRARAKRTKRESRASHLVRNSMREGKEIGLNTEEINRYATTTATLPLPLIPTTSTTLRCVCWPDPDWIPDRFSLAVADGLPSIAIDCI